ncbi:trypsin-like peptidase domain-containing protein [Nocardia sp. 2]|uniref:Trypsin-like peptidase domain-containing protein n=1 Tax=Nocardia acididurans TaxID=2802282 RepID=A0ABS1M642_9NOCA|nr:trypsin-like peptidase domain-containing protein [Nocardia acididurans]MBL1076108.1 trypsin-like peptidase domain-containing protein [Nocardia acididurans]
MTTESKNTGPVSGEGPAENHPRSSAETSDSAADRGNLRPSDAPVLGPRPVYRPHVDTHTARAFRRPNGQNGSFSPRPEGAVLAKSPQPGAEVVNRPPDAVLAEAFGRPAGSDELLQRDPDAQGEQAKVAGPADPWRDPNAPARLGAPAIATPQPAPLAPGHKLSAREVLFGGRVSAKALAILGAVALVIGLAGGLVGRLTGESTSALTSRKVELQSVGGDASPDTQIGKVVNAVMPAVVTIHVSIGDNGASGSGVVIDGAGYIVTNNHVISMAANDKTGKAKLQVLFADDTRVNANIVGRDPKSDLAVLKVDVKNLSVIQLGNSADVKVGDEVLAIGSPLSLRETVTSGIVSALNRPVKLGGEGTDTDATLDAVQTDAAINHGNSGGALVDMQGRLIGINTAIKSESGGSVGLGFAIPIDKVKQISQGLIRDGKVNHSRLGVSAKTAAVANEAMSGAQVADVSEGGPAAKAGIVEGDVIIKVGDRNVESPEELTVAVQSHAIGETVTVKLIRDGREVDVPVTLESD